jgi:hypothetical protein
VVAGNTADRVVDERHLAWPRLGNVRFPGFPSAAEGPFTHVTEVMVNGADDVFVERKGRLERAPDGLFEGQEAVLRRDREDRGPARPSGR